MTDDWTVIIAIATSTTAIIGVVTWLLLESQRRINQNNPIILFSAEKVLLLDLVEQEAKGELGEELKAGMPSIVRNADIDSTSWSNAVDKLIRYGLAEVSNGYLRVTEPGKRYAWRKHRENVRAILLRVEETKHR